MGKIGPFHSLTTSSPPLDEIFQGVPEGLAVSAPADLWNISEGGRKHGLLLRVGGAVLVLLISFCWFKISQKSTTGMKKFSHKVSLYIILLQNNKSNPWLGYSGPRRYEGDYHPPSRRILGSTESHVKWSRTPQ